MRIWGIETENSSPAPVRSLDDLYQLADEIAHDDGIDQGSAFAVAVAVLTQMGDIDDTAPVCSEVRP